MLCSANSDFLALHSINFLHWGCYGTWYPSEECPSAIITLIIQLVLGVIVDATIVGIFYEKFIRPPKYSHSEFSKNAVICHRDGKLCLLFRVADFRGTRSIDSKVRAYLFEDVIANQDEIIDKKQTRLKLEESGRVFMIWPQTLCHVIDENSPFYGVDEREMKRRRFELVVGLKGESSYSGHTTQSKTSYLHDEILMGFRFANMIFYDENEECYVADLDKMDELEEECLERNLDDE